LLHALVWYFRREAKTMRWKISHRHHGGHDPRQIDLIAIFVLLIIIVTAFRFYSAPEPPSTASFIDPSQSVRW
jgi:Trk-type K+ transport system membrane component